MCTEAKTPQQEEMELYETAVEVYGADMQVVVAMEEMAELIQALSKWMRARREPYPCDCDSVADHILEEMADVSIMLCQLEVIFGDYSGAESYKLERLRARLAEELQDERDLE